MPQATEDLNRPVSDFARSDFARVGVEQTVGEALAALRGSPVGGRVVYFYALDAAGRLQGVIPTRALLLSPLQRPIRDLMVRRVISIPPTATLLEACDLFILHRLMALPVVDAEGRMVGVIDVDHYSEKLSDLSQRELSEDVFQLIGVRLARVRRASPASQLRFRFPWLLCNIAGGLACALLARGFDRLLEEFFAVALFIPVVLTLAESVSIQTLSLTLQTHHGHRIAWRQWLRDLAGEAPVGLLLGLATGGIVAGLAWLWLGNARLAAGLLAGLTAAVTAGAVFGLTIPTLLHALQRDPKVASGPIVLALTDLATLLAYFAAAAWLLL